MSGLIAVLFKSLTNVGIKLFMTFASERMIEWMFFKVAQAIADSTKTKKDDEWVNKIRNEYKGIDEPTEEPLDHVK